MLTARGIANATLCVPVIDDISGADDPIVNGLTGADQAIVGMRSLLANAHTQCVLVMDSLQSSQ